MYDAAYRLRPGLREVTTLWCKGRALERDVRRELDGARCSTGRWAPLDLAVGGVEEFAR